MNDLSVIIITKNCAENLKRCLESLNPLEAEVIVVDSHSTDQTMDIARQYTDHVYEEDWKGYAAQKNSALDKTTRPWVLWMDSDEELTPYGREQVSKVVAENKQEVGGYTLLRRSQFMGAWMDHCWSGDYVLRLFRKTKAVHFPERKVHEKVSVEGQVLPLKQVSLNHYPAESLDGYLEKSISYANLAAQELQDRGKKASALRIVTAFPETFVKMFIFKFGFLDGLRGFVLILLSSMYHALKYIKFWELQKFGFMASSQENH